MKSSNFGKAFAAIALSLSLVACGGGGGGSSPAPVAVVPTPPVVVTPPVVTPPDQVVVITPVILPAIKVQASSYLNAKTLNMAPQVLPQVDSTFYEQITNGFAYADFAKNGSLQLVAFTELVPLNGTDRVAPGKVHFFKKVGDKWVDNTADIVDNTDGCITPRKVLIADFNNDTRPDVYASCSGLDFGKYSGEKQRVLLSQADGKYKNVVIDQTGYAHGASAADVNNDGNVDILIADMGGNGGKNPLYFLMGDGKGNFTVDYDRVDRQELQYKAAFWTVELVKDSATNEYNIVAGGTELSGTNTQIIKGVSGKYSTSPVTILPGVSGFETVMDFVIEGNTVYVLRTTEKPVSYNGSAIQKINATTGEMSIVYQHTGQYPGKYNNWPATWINWITPYNDTIISQISYFGVSIAK